MSQPSVASYFTTRKRRASEELRAKSKVLILDDNGRKEVMPIIPEGQITKVEQIPAKSMTKVPIKKEMVVRNLQFDLCNNKTTKPITSKPRATRTRKVVEDTRQPDIRETLLKVNKEIEENKNVVFQKLGSLSPKKIQKRVTRATKSKPIIEPNFVSEPTICKTPTKSLPMKTMSLDEVKTKITCSSRLAELRARINKFKNCEGKLEKLENKLQEKRLESKANENRIKIKEFERIELEIPVSPQKTPRKFTTPTKTIHLSPKASPARRLLFEPKEVPASPVKSSPTKVPAYQKYQSLVDIEGKALPLPYKYRFLVEVFRSVDTVAAILYNRREIITFAKLKPAVQELMRRNFTVEHLAQIKSVYPQAYTFTQEKLRSFGTGAPDRYELVITPMIVNNQEHSGRNTPDEDNVLKSALETNMSPSVLLDRRRKLYNILLSIVKEEHEKFLLDLDPPMRISKEMITRWHPEFDVESCREIERAKLPQPPVQEKASTAKEVLEKANKMLNGNSRMMKAVEMLAGGQTQTVANVAQTTGTTEQAGKMPYNVEISIVDTPPATPQTQKPTCTPLLNGIPMSLLEKIRVKQAQKALEMMTRSTEANKDAVMYARLPEMAKIVRNIFVGEKKNVLLLEHVVKKLDDSYRTKLTPIELEQHIKLLCKLLPLWATLHVVRKIDYLKLAKDFDMTKVIKRLEVLANEKA
ncbi:DNA replication factor Cdt1 [Phymastichus coffea]|uniref:DNA replication factor Cdt1 n=1 Tax=Phymastichus coffea TaxID=108790 RepID=UPI00273A86E0|nr:DNA replication factor Cdt1 [Phymastichus coffea]